MATVYHVTLRNVMVGASEICATSNQSLGQAVVDALNAIAGNVAVLTAVPNPVQ